MDPSQRLFKVGGPLDPSRNHISGWLTIPLTFTLLVACAHVTVHLGQTQVYRCDCPVTPVVITSILLKNCVYFTWGKHIYILSYPRFIVLCSVCSRLESLSHWIGNPVLQPKGGFYLMNSDRRSMRLVSRIGIAVVIALAMMLPLAASAHTDVSNGKLKNFQHVFIIMMENTSYTSLIGNPNAPWINMAAQTYGLATNYTGVSHPSQPNYIAATSGALNGVFNDNPTTINVPNIVDQLEANAKTWKAY